MKLFSMILFKGMWHFLRNSNQREFMRLVLLYGDVRRYSVRKVKFLSYEITVPDCLSFIWQFKDIFSDENYKFIAKGSSPVVYDCGANIGLSCLYFKRLYPKAQIKAFEADPSIAGLLKANLAANHINDIEVISKAVWTGSDGIEIGIEGADGASVYSEAGRKIKIESVRLRELLEREDCVDMLKMDIEGAETEVIRDCADSLGNVKHFFIEYHDFINRPQALDEILCILRKSGFRYFIRQAADRLQPFVVRTNKNLPASDMQLNIYAYRD